MAKRAQRHALILAVLATLALPDVLPDRQREADLARITARREAAAKRPHSSPGAAAAYWSARRQPQPGVDPGRELERARRRRAAMPQHSLARGGLVARITAEPLEPWEWLGPGNIGGRTRALAIHPRRPKTMWAGGVSGGIWKTENAGRRWRPVADELVNIAVNALALDPRDPAVLYAGTGEGYFREVVRGTGLPLRGGGIFKSEDGGESWRRLRRTRGAKFHWVNDIVVSRHDSDRVYAATRKGVFRSADGGQRWRRVLNPKVRGGCLDLEIVPDAPGDLLFASCGTFERATVYRNQSAETAGGWEAVLSEPAMGRTSVAVAPSDPTVVYALAASNTPGPGGNYEQALHAVFRSDASGAAGSWEARVRNDDPRKINTLLLSNAVIAMLVECDFDVLNDYLSMGWYVNVLAVSPDDPDILFAAGVDLFRSRDGGRNWSPASYWWTSRFSPAWLHADLHGLVFHPTRSRTLFALGDGGIARTSDALAPTGEDALAVCRPESSSVRWQDLNNDYGVTQFYHGSVHPNGRGYLGGTQDNGTLLGTDGSGPGRWVRILGGDGGYSAIDPVNPARIYATFQNGEVQRSSDGGRSFQDATFGITDLALGREDGVSAQVPGFLFISPLVMDPSEPRRLWLGGRRLWRTDNGADSWTAASVQLADGGKASAVAVAPGDPDRVVVGSSAGGIHRSLAATTTDGLTEWEAATPRADFVTWVAFDPADPDTVYATYGGFGGAHVFRSGDGGAEWTAIDGTGRGRLPAVPVHSIVVDPADRDVLYVGTDVGVFVSLDRGGSWAAEHTGFATAVTESLTLVETGDAARWLFAFTHGRGAWRVGL
ncbi:MAG: hypothetical protein R3325_03070 [Thermoanaerobaculia bacterium]|nr:hypothetical protein [Thermoanaerobaculia bacterium]